MAIDFTKSEMNELKDNLHMKELEVSKLNKKVEDLEQEMRNQRFFKLQFRVPRTTIPETRPE